MIHSQRIQELQNEQVEAEVNRRMSIAAVMVFIEGEEVDISDQTLCGEEIHISIENPVYFSKTGKTGHITVETPKSMVK